jgi:hypothetical protein
VENDSIASVIQALPAEARQNLPVSVNFSTAATLRADNGGERILPRLRFHSGNRAMMARWLFVFSALAALASSGCCCFGPCGGRGSYPTAACGPACGGGGCESGACRAAPCNNGCGLFANGCCCLCLPKPIVWCGNCSECGPNDCESCACPSDCGILSFCRWNKSCGKGCGEIYYGEWYSDPPDCCDPCDQCFGQWTGPHGYCRLGPMQHLLAAFHGYKYCPKPCCDDWCGGFCNKPACTSCGGGGCASCGGGEHISQGSVMPATPGEVYYEHAPHGQSILNENWDRPTGPKPMPGKPIHKAQQPGQIKVGQAKPAPPQPTYGRMVRTAANWGR